jgi:hypothetical protein
VYPKVISLYPHVPQYARRPEQARNRLLHNGQDAQCIASFNRDSPIWESQLKELILRDLGRLHARSGIAYDFLAAQYIMHHAFDWGHNPLTRGIRVIWTRTAADGGLHFVGKALSTSCMGRWCARVGATGCHALLAAVWATGLVEEGRRALGSALRGNGRLVPHRMATLQTTKSLGDLNEHRDADKDEKSSTHIDDQPSIVFAQSGCYTIVIS